MKGHSAIPSHLLHRAAPDEGRIFRSVSIDSGSVNKDERTVAVCFSSEAPVKRRSFWGDTFYEVLSHDTDACDLSRLNDGAAVLFNHDLNAYVGTVKKATIEADKKGRAVLQFNKAGRGAEIFDDILTGALRYISVGYQIDEITQRDGDQETRIATRWTPYEISIVTVPADINAAIGRNFQVNNPPNQTMKTRQELIAALTARGITHAADATDAQLRALLEDAEKRALPPPVAPAPAPAVPPAPSVTVAINDTRIIGILDLAKNYRSSIANADELADTAIRNGSTADTFARALLDELNKRGHAGLSETGVVGLSDKEVQEFSFVRLFRALTASPHERSLVESAAHEFAVCNAAAEIANKAGRGTRGMFIPDEVLRGNRSVISAGAISGGTGTGNQVIANTFRPEAFLDILRNKCILLQFVSGLSGLQGTISMPKQTSFASSGWIGEGDDAPETDINFGQDALSKKTVASYARLTRDMLNQPSIDVENLVRRELAKSAAFAIDTAGFYGTGAGGQPLGIKNTSGVNAVSFGGTIPSYDGVVAMETAIASDNADIGAMAYILNATNRGKMKTTKRFPTSGTDTVLWEPGDTLNGYRTGVTQQVSDVDLFFGVWSELYFAQWGGIEVLADRNVRNGGAEISIFQDVNFSLRRPECFCLGSLA